MAQWQGVDESVEKGVKWLKSMQNENGSYGKWGLGSTCLAVIALLKGKVLNTEPAVARAVSYILNTQPLDSVYFRSLSIMALVANNEKTPEIFERVSSDVKWLVEHQEKNRDNEFFGGWGSVHDSETTESSKNQMAIVSLYAGVLWGMNVSQATLERAISWYRKKFNLLNNGNNYESKDLYSIIIPGLASLKIINLLAIKPEVKAEVEVMIDKVYDWLKKNYTTHLAGVPDSLFYYYAYSLVTGCLIEPCLVCIGKHHFYADIASYLVSSQQPDGEWKGESEKKSTEVVHTSFAILALTRYAIAMPVKISTETGDSIMHYKLMGFQVTQSRRSKVILPIK